ncbi:hypothetical protein GCM10010191_45170 [Actinomadura vinacea]|uniref:Uncharacterized protein n=1 Tax=Actinomadura vinacea TaxID=115336 RepID=A0ABN3JCU7_9ACTN
MSFTVHARKVRDPSLPQAWRASALRSCVQLYRPIGFHATLDYLEAKAGPFERDEAALLRALALIESSRAAWHAAIREYDQARRDAKREGHRKPRWSGPFSPTIWYGAPQEAALHAVRYWQGSQLPALLTRKDQTARALAACVAACLASEGGLAPADRETLQVCREELERRLRNRPSGFADAEYFRVRDLLTVAGLLKTACEPVRECRT